MATLNNKQMFLSNIVYYSYTDSLDKTAFNFTFRYSIREACWYFDIYTNDNIPIILSTKLVIGYPMLKDFALDSKGITGFFLLYPKVEANTGKLTTDPKRIADYFDLTYFYEV